MNSNSEPAGFYQSTQTDEDETSDTPATSTVSGNIYSTDFSVFTDGSKIVNTIGELSNTYSFTVNEDGILVSDGITVGENTVLPAEYSYDDSGRNTEKIITLASNTEPVSFLQQYDSEGMLTGSGIDEITAHYTYDDSDQLIRTNDSFANYTSSYEYDNRGNMLSKKLYNYTTGDLGTAVPTETTTFTYANSGWKDQLTAVNGTALTYDENGNLLTYGDKTFSWCHGSRLESITDSENTYSYVYDENGTRFSKTVNGTTTQFNYVGGLLLSQKTGEDIIFFQYGAGGVPLGFVYNGTQYFYVTNQLGDVLGITDDTGDAFVMYSYDEWGNPIQTVTRDNTEEQNKIAQLNPLRYRGYYYDAETGYYYLQSRYYNPEWGRFISADSFDYIDNTARFGFNAYIYCINNPIMFVDPSGSKAISSSEQSKMKKRFEDYMRSKGFTSKYKLNNAINKSYDIYKDSDGLYTVACEYRMSYNEYYHAVFIYGDTQAWRNVYDSSVWGYFFTLDTSGAVSEAAIGLSIASLIIRVIAFVIIIVEILPVFFLISALMDEQRKNSLTYYNLSQSNGYYEYLQTFSHTYFNNGKQTTVYIVET